MRMRMGMGMETGRATRPVVSRDFPEEFGARTHLQAREGFSEEDEAAATTAAATTAATTSSSIPCCATRRTAWNAAANSLFLATATATTTTPALWGFPSASLAAAAAAGTSDRCDPLDPGCGADGKRSEVSAKPVPRVTNRITHVVQLVIAIGERREEVGFLRFGLYGDDCPESVRSMILFLSPVGISGLRDGDGDDDDQSGNGFPPRDENIDTKRSPVTLLQGGVVPAIYPNRGVEFGVPSQKKAYARSLGLREAGASFVPERRPASTSGEAGTRPHDVAGLVSIPLGGIGYGSNRDDSKSNGNGKSNGKSKYSPDEAYASAFLITAGDNDFDVFKNRRVIGQVIDDESMEFLERLSSLPIQKQQLAGGGGGNTKGPPLLRVTVLDTGIQKVGASNNNNNNNNKNQKSSRKR